MPCRRGDANMPLPLLPSAQTGDRMGCPWGEVLVCCRLGPSGRWCQAGAGYKSQIDSVCGKESRALKGGALWQEDHPAVVGLLWLDSWSRS